MLGYKLQRVVVAVLFAVTFLLAIPLLNIPQFMVVAATTEDVEAGGRKKDTESSEKKVQDATKSADKKDEDKTEKLPPLDLGTGVTAKDDIAPEDALSGGVTATKQKKDGEAINTSSTNAETNTDTLDPKRLWTPNSGRFLLKDRQAGLSLASSADKVDKGDGKQTKPAPPKATKPVAVKPVETLENVFTSLELLTEFTVVEPIEPDAGSSGDLPGFIELADNSAALDIADDGQADGVSSNNSTETPGNSQLVFDQTGDETEAGASDAIDAVGVIRPNGLTGDTTPGTPYNDSPNLFQSNTELGESVVGVSPWRGWAVFLFCLGLIFAAYWASQKFKGKIGGISKKTLSVIETIGIGAGRQIIIIEMHNDALILGVTPHSINLLDKVPIEALNSGYSSMVGGIISREGNALQEQWEERPSFEADIQAPTLAPPIQTGTYGPSGQAKTSIAELRRTRQPQASTKAFAQVVEGPGNPSPKEELIGRFRSQLNRFED